MRAYLAILADSYREARANRVLWISLIGIAVILLLLAPINLSKEKALRLRRTELAFPDQMLEKFTTEKDTDGTPSAHLWSLLSTGQRNRVTELLEGKGRSPRRGPGGGAAGEVLRVLNELLRNEKFYDATAWADVELTEEAQELVDVGELVGDDMQRRNLLLLAAAFPTGIRLVDNTAIGLYYANAEIIAELPFPPSQLNNAITIGVTAILGVFLGIIGIFCSLLVTAGVIPRTFEPGEIALMLSKPINRAGLFLVKFLGGCTFTLLYASVLVTGVWLLLGIRLDYWQSDLLWCIPIYVFLFMIYYAVSAVSGAIWRNPIVALVCVVIFYIALQTVAITKTQMQSSMIEARAIREVIPMGDDVFMVDGEQKTYVWDENDQNWDEKLKRTSSGMAELMRGRLAEDYRFLPVYDADEDRLLALQASASRFTQVGPPVLVAGYREDDWERQPLGRLPAMVRAIHRDGDGRLILPGQNAIYEYVGQTEKERKRADFLNGVTRGLLGGGRAFREVQAKGMPDFGKGFESAMHPSSHDVYMLGDGKVCRMERGDDDVFSVTQEASIDSDERGVIAAGGNVCIIALRGGRILVFDAKDLSLLSDSGPQSEVSPRLLVASPEGGRLALLTHSQMALIWDGATGEQLQRTALDGKTIGAIAFRDNGALLASDGRLAVMEYDGSQLTASQRWAEQPSFSYTFYDYFVLPVWSILPKPAELDGFIPYVMDSEQIPDDGPPLRDEGDSDSLEQEDDQFDAWGIVRANAAFICILLVIGCVYVIRRDY